MTLLDGSQPTFEKRGAPIGLILESLRPKSYSRESFAGRKAHPLDAAHIAQVKAFVETSMHELGIPGVGLALVDDGKVVYEGGLGVRELGKPEPVDENTLFMATVSVPVLVFTLMVSILTGLAFGSIPAFSQRLDLVNSLKEGTNAATEKGSRHRMRNVLAMGQVAISFMLLIGAGLMIRSFIKLQQVDAGYNGENVLSASIPLNFSKYANGMSMNSVAIKNFYDRVVQKLEATPGIEGVAVNSGAPLAPNRPQKLPFVIDGRPTEEKEKPQTDAQVASPDAFRLLGVPLIVGRFFTSDDSAWTP